MNRRHGFTLVEVLVALTIGALVVLLTHQVYASTVDGISRIRQAQEQLESNQLGRRWMEGAFLSMEAGNRGGGFEGHVDRVGFSTWLLSQEGWVERRNVTLLAQGGRLVARTDGGVSTVLPNVTSVAFDYLLEPGLDSRWVNDWVSPVSIPLGVRVRLRREVGVDTMLFLIKGRG